MRVEITESGPVVAAEDVAPLLGVAPADLPRLMREGVVTARHEVGVGEDAGRFRMVFRYRDCMVRLTCAGDGEVVSRVRTSSGPPAGTGG